MSKNSGQNSQTPEKGVSSNASTSDGTGYRLGSLVPGIGTPIVDDNSKIQRSHPEVRFLRKIRQITANRTVEQMAVDKIKQLKISYKQSRMKI